MSFSVNAEGYRCWEVCIEGPNDTPYANGTFFFSIVFPDSYPYESPRVSFSTLIYHPNIFRPGEIDIDILGRKYSPTLKIRDLIKGIKSLLINPNHDLPFNDDLMDQFQTDRDRFDEIARNWTQSSQCDSYFNFL